MTLGLSIWLLLDIVFEWLLYQVVWKVLQNLRGHRWSWLTVDNIPPLVTGVSFKCTQNPRLSCSRFHWIPRALSDGRLSVMKFQLFTLCPLFSSGFVVSTSFSLYMNFLRQNPPALHIFLTSSTSFRGTSQIFTDLSKSST